MLQKKKFSFFHPQNNFTIFIQIEPSINVSLPIKRTTDTCARNKKKYTLEEFNNIFFLGFLCSNPKDGIKAFYEAEYDKTLQSL